MYGSMIACLVLALLFIPIYDRTLKILSRSYGKSISKATPFIKGGLFVLRIIALFILIMSIISEYEQIKTQFYATFHFRASSSEMSRLANFIKNDQRTEFENAITEIQNKQKNIDFPLLIARNFEAALEQAKNDPNSAPAINGTYALEQRLQLYQFSTVDSVLNNLTDYSTSNLAPYLPPQKMLSLLLEYGQFYLGYENIHMAYVYFYSAIKLDPGNNETTLIIGDYFKEMDLLAEAARNYEKYSTLMKNEGDERLVPKRVKDFLSEGLYGENLQKNLFECWLADQFPDIDSIEANDQLSDVGYLFIGSKLYSAFRGTPLFALFGPQYTYSKLDSMNCGLAGCVSKLLGGEPQKMNVDAIVELCGGINFYSENDQPFTNINPEIIVWARKNLIPDPELILIDKPCIAIYNNIFRDVFRQKALAFTFLQSYWDPEACADDYKARMYDSDFHAPAYLYEKFYDVADETPGEYYFDKQTLVQDTGFWIRRFIDGSAVECWNLVSAIMSRYDQEWFDQVWVIWSEQENESGESGGV
jgi:hypothetical protein